MSGIWLITTKGKSQEMPAPLCLAAIVVGPPREGIQKKPSVSSPYDEDTEQKLVNRI